MPLLNYTTSIAAHKTVMEIQQLLAKGGASKIMADYDDAGNVVSMSFQILLEGQPIAFHLPTDWKPVYEVLRRDGKVPQRLRTEEQALRVAWRITKDWVEAQIAIVQTRMVTTAQVFLPYAVTRDGSTVFEYMANNTGLLLGPGEK